MRPTGTPGTEKSEGPKTSEQKSKTVNSIYLLIEILVLKTPVGLLNLPEFLFGEDFSKI
jgi:hypothetical protein